MRMPEPRPLGETFLDASVRAIVSALLVNSPAGGCVESVFTFETHRFPLLPGISQFTISMSSDKGGAEKKTRASERTANRRPDYTEAICFQPQLSVGSSACTCCFARRGRSSSGPFGANCFHCGAMTRSSSARPSRTTRLPRQRRSRSRTTPFMP